MATKDFSVIIPTFTGAETISDCFESILLQTMPSDKTFEVIVVIDGPNKILVDVCNKYRKSFLQKNIDFEIKQFQNNKGRFEARLKGAQLASSDQLLFLDDRITFGKNYFEIITSLRKKILIPNVIETTAKNYVSRCLYLLRRFIYGKKKFGTTFKSFYITEDNFESSPKGTTSLWANKQAFTAACKQLSKERINSKYTNEDTKLFKMLINMGENLYKSSEAIIYYQPRAGAWEEIKHIYHRGPRFVDYYIRPGTRFRPLLIISIVGSLLIVILAFTDLELLMQISLFTMALLIAGAFLIREKYNDIPKLIIGLPAITASFILGLYKGVIVWLIGRVGKA